MKNVENMLQMQENVFYWVGKRIYGPDLRYRADQPKECQEFQRDGRFLQRY